VREPASVCALRRALRNARCGRVSKKFGGHMKHIDNGSMFVIVTTFVLFVLALFVKGLAHDILLEAGVFLVSVKLIIMAYKANVSAENIENELKDVKEILNQHS
jgi:hypothetical protein